MRFSNEDYLKAFPREDKHVNPNYPNKRIVKDEHGDVTDTSDEKPENNDTDNTVDESDQDLPDMDQSDES